MFRRKQINDVFNYTTPISAEQINQRAFVNRSTYKERLLGAILQDGLLVMSGYSSIGKTTLINLVTARGELSRSSMPFRAVVSVTADNFSGGSILKGIYDGISKYTSGKKPEAFSPPTLAEAVHTNQLLLIIDGVNSLYDDPSSSKELFNFCKSWTDLPRGTRVQSKIILVASGLSGQVSQWLSQAGAGKRLPREQINIPLWDPRDLLSIVDIGSQRLGIAFEPDLKRWMVKVACGLPATMTLLAALTARRANNERNEILSDKAIRVDLTDLYGIFGESSKFQEVLYYDSKMESLSVSALLSLYLLGINGGEMSEGAIYRNLELFGFAKGDVAAELEGLIFVERKRESVFWNIKELSYGTFGFLRLYLRSKLSSFDAEEIAKTLHSLNESGLVISDETQPSGTLKTLESFHGANDMIPILFLAADPTDASRLRLGKEFREIDEQLTLAKQRDHFNLALPQLSLRSKDLARAMLNVQPQVVHFSGHGTSEGALCFENEIGQTHLVRPEALAALFEQFASQVNCVLLNACFSDIQAKAIAQHINYVIGMSQAISDNAAIAFSIGFYQALGAGRTIEEAYRLGCVQIRLQDIPEHLTPVLIKKAR